MNQIQFFYDDELFLLQEKINKWLSENKHAEIISTDLNSLGKPSSRAGMVATEKYVFFILYRTDQASAEAIVAEAANDIPVAPPGPMIPGDI